MILAFVKRWWRVATDLVVLVILGCITLFLDQAGERGLSVRRGFFCDDESIRYPYQPHPAVPSWALVVGTLSIPIATIILGNCYERYCIKRPDCQPLTVHRRLRVAPWIVRAGYHLRWFLLGGIITVLITNMGKVVVGRLRPHFISVCEPDFGEFNCTDQFGNPVYVTDYKCMGHKDLENESRLSFPSGHSSLSTYAFVFLALYLASLRSPYHRSALKLLLMLVSFLLALLTSLSRVSDHRHHPTDVLAGMILGGLVAGMVVFYNLFYFSHHRPPSGTHATSELPTVTTPCLGPRKKQHTRDSSDSQEL